ncbi:N-acetyltransferase family protein [Aliiroseovarius sp. S1339]|uniref:GNAT family N-acetyltransferase n=1 Tax=Aliiroseovarius sp. S1339 TaxID=2936990 RepID=UPI0020C0C8AB|nr:GNAT family N-acetyltransferase [Aliiroseovarius sp. S1339]MCK8465237.1 N-acetyltransferase family protein [Aliiroseovarius sp. S1339]
MIRPATKADVPAIQALWNFAIRETLITFNSVGKSPDEVAKAIAEFDAFLVAEDAGQVIGFAALFPFRSGVGYAQTKEHSIMLSAEARGRGLGRALMVALEDAARALGVRSLIAGVSASNPDGVPFHAAMGFTTVGRVKQAGCKFDQWHDLVLMQKLL